MHSLLLLFLNGDMSGGSSSLLLESGSYLLLEDGSVLLLE